MAQKAKPVASAKTKTAKKVEFPNIFRPIGNVFSPVGNWFTGLFVGRSKIIFCPAHPWVDKVTLSRPEISLSCVGYYSPCSDKSALVEVFAEGGSYQNEPFVYKYQVNGGKIVGSGERVAWDLSGVKTGTYHVTAYAEDTEYGLSGLTKTEFVTIVE